MANTNRQHALLDVQDLAITIGNRTLLRDVSFRVGEGEFVTILGENGCGKSSLFNTVMGFHENYVGNIALAGKSIAKQSQLEMSETRAYLSQFNNVNFAYLVEDILLLARHNQSEPLPVSFHIIETVVDMLDINHLLGRNINLLSGGEKQRVFIAKALIQLWNNPVENDGKVDFSGKLLFLDEPTSALDVRHQQQLLELLSDLKHRGLATICISHDINLFSRISDRFLILANQTLLAKGSPKDVLNATNMQSGFGYRPQFLIDPSGHPYLVHDLQSN